MSTSKIALEFLKLYDDIPKKVYCVQDSDDKISHQTNLKAHDLFHVLKWRVVV